MLAHPTAASTICEGHRRRLFAAQNSSGLYRWPLVRHSMGSSSSSHQAPASVGPWGWLQRTFSTQAHAAAITPTAAAQLQHPRKPTHLVVMVNGLFGGPGNWDVVREELQQQLDPQHTILHPSQVNQRTATYDGIDVCGQRLADEVRTLVARHPSLTRISFLAHSMGGLLSRYAIGVLYQPTSGTICGLQPCHFISMATPHMGCDAAGPAQVPFIGWTQSLPLVGGPLQGLLQDISVPTASLLFKRTGQQFFLEDGNSTAAANGAAAAVGKPAAGEGGSKASSSSKDSKRRRTDTTAAQLPLLVQMTQDNPDKGLFFYSGLAAFKTRTAYANVSGDHLVGWSNSSLRAVGGLPQLPAEQLAKAKGVVCEDAFSSAFYEHDWRVVEAKRSAVACNTAAHGGSSSSSGGSSAAGLVRQASGDRMPRVWHALDSSEDAPAISTSQQQQQQQQREVESSPPDPLLTSAAVMAEAAGAVGAGTTLAAAAVAAGNAGAAPTAPGQPSQDVSGESSSALNSQEQQQAAAAVAGAGSDLQQGLLQAHDIAPAESPEEATAAVAAEAAGEGGAAAAAAWQVPGAGGRAGQVQVMLHRLQELPWRRVDVCFTGGLGFAHNKIQVTRKWLDFSGRGVVRHLAQQVVHMEELVAPLLEQPQQQPQPQPQPQPQQTEPQQQQAAASEALRAAA